MATSSLDSQQAIATSSTPAAEFRELPRTHRRRVFFQLPETLQQFIVEDMNQEQLHEFVRWLDPDDATDVLGLTEEETQTAILRRLDENRREGIGFLLEFNPESAAGIMHLNYVSLDVDSSFDDIAQRVRRYEKRTGRFPSIFITDGRVLGKNWSRNNAGPVEANESVLKTTERDPRVEVGIDVPADDDADSERDERCDDPRRDDAEHHCLIEGVGRYTETGDGPDRCHRG